MRKKQVNENTSSRNSIPPYYHTPVLPPMTSQDKLARLEKITKMALEDYPSADELKTLVQLLIKSVGEAKTSLAQTVAQHKGQMTDEARKAVAQLDATIDRIEAMFSAHKREVLSTVSETRQQLRTEIKGLGIQLDDLPRLEALIREIEAKIPPELLGEDFRNGLEALQDDDRLDKSAIKGLDEIEKDISELKKRPTGGGGGGGITGRDLFKDIDLSSQLDGITTTFNIPVVWNIISVDLSSFPYGSLRKGVDYTFTPTSITFTSQIDPATQLAAGQSCILTVVTG